MEDASLPGEMVSEILSYFRCTPPTSLDGLQVAFTCRQLYKEFLPLIAAFQIEQLVEASTVKAFTRSVDIHIYKDLGEMGPRMVRYDFRRRAGAAFSRSLLDTLSQSDSEEDTGAEFSDIVLTYIVNSPLPDHDVATLWSLASLVSKHHVAVHLRRFVLKWVPKRQGDPNPPVAWNRALVSLLKTCVEVTGVEIALEGATFYNHDSGLGLSSIGPPPISKPDVFRNSRVSSLTLGGTAIPTFWRTHLDALVIDSANSLTDLCISRCPPPSDSWAAIFSQWRFPRLEWFEIKEMEIPFDVIVSFLLCHPSITFATISSTEKCSNAETIPLLQAVDRPRFLPRLRDLISTLDFLLPLFTPGSDPNEALLLPHLESLTVHYYDSNRRKPADGDNPDYDRHVQLLSYLREPLKTTGSEGRPSLRELFLHIPHSARLEHWLKSANPASAPGAPPTVGGISSSNLPQGKTYNGVSRFGNTLSQMPKMVESLVNPSTTSSIESASHPSPLSIAVASFSNLSSLRLNFYGGGNFSGYPPNCAIHPDSLVRFASVFPKLKNLAVNGAFYRPQNAVQNAEELWAGLGRAWSVCPMLEMMEVHNIGGSETPAVWRGGEAEPTPGFGFNDWAAAFLMVI